MVKSKLLPTRAKTAEKRRLELGNPKYAKKHAIHIRKVYRYDGLPEIKPTDLGKPENIRFFKDGIEAIVKFSADFESEGTNYTLLVLEEKKTNCRFLLLNNFCCVIQEVRELDIKAEFKMEEAIKV